MPDITSGFLSTQYDASSDLLTVSGFALTLEADGVAPPDEDIISGIFDLSVTVDSTGAITPGVGTLNISGQVSSGGPSLLTGEVAAFGFLDGGGEIFEFLFDVTGGDLAGSFGPLVGVIVDANDSGFAGAFESSFSNSGFGVSDTGMIPEPATVGLLIVGVFATSYRRRRT